MKTRDGKDHWGKNSAWWDLRDEARLIFEGGCDPWLEGPLRRMRAVTGSVALLFVLCVPVAFAKPAHPLAHHRILGWYTVAMVNLAGYGLTPIAPACRALAANFNQFRTVPFASRNPRLSTKYPQFRRPHWTPMAWNRRLAKEIFTGCPRGDCKKGSGWGPVWRYWLKQTKVLRQAGKPVLWRTTVDLLGNGQRETIVRLEHILPYTFVYGRFVPEPIPPYSPYIDRKLYMLPSPNPQLAKVFNSNLLFSWGWRVGWKQGGFMGPTDLIENTHDKKHPYYVLSWRRVGHRGEGVIGVSVIKRPDPPFYGYLPFPLCNIEWVTKGQRGAQ